jgi:hypothetical protein
VKATPGSVWSSPQVWGWGCYCLWVGIKERNSPSRSKGAVESGCMMHPSESVISRTLRPGTRSHMWTAPVCTRSSYGYCDSPDVTGGVALQASYRPPRICIPHVRLPAAKVPAYGISRVPLVTVL